MLKKIIKIIASTPEVLALYANPFLYYFSKLSVSGRQRLLICNLRNGLRFKIHAGNSDINSINEIFFSDLYKKLFNELKSDSIVIDIGANIGIVSVAAGVKVNEGQIFAFEPNPEVFSILEENIKLNNMEKKIIPSPLCVASTSGKRDLHFEPTMWGGASIAHVTQKTTSTYSVDCISLNELVDSTGKESIDFVKIDVEGAEQEILSHTTNATFDKISAMLIEYHEPLVSPLEIKKILEQNSFVVEESGNFSAFFARKERQR